MLVVWCGLLESLSVLVYWYDGVRVVFMLSFRGVRGRCIGYLGERGRGVLKTGVWGFCSTGGGSWVDLAQNLPSGAPDDRAWCATPPVLYTHLRAHETMANLVGRLLLEKKKTKYNID